MLAPLRIYQLTGNTLVDSELKSYATVLDEFAAALQGAELDCFISSASLQRMDRWEQLLGLAKSLGLSTGDRRARILHCLAVTPMSFTPQGIKNSLQGMGIGAAIKENIPMRSLDVKCLAFMGDYGNVYQMIEAASRVMPAHLRFTIDTGGLSWTDIEAKYLSWLDWDQEDFTWEDFDIQSTPA